MWSRALPPRRRFSRLPPAARSRASRISPAPSAMSRRSSATPSRPRMRATGWGGGTSDAACRREARNVRRGRRRRRGLLHRAPRAGRRSKGRVLAEDIMPEVRDALSERVQRERLDNVAVKLGTPDDPMLPRAVVRPDLPRAHVSRSAVALRVPVAHARGLEAGRRSDLVVDANRPVKQHGIPPAQADMRVRGAGPGAGEIQRAERRRSLSSRLSGSRGRGRSRTRSSPARARASPFCRKLVHSLPAKTR